MSSLLQLSEREAPAAAARRWLVVGCVAAIGLVGAVGLFVGPLVAVLGALTAAVLVALPFRPVFARWQAEWSEIVTRGEHPRMFAVLDEIAAALGEPRLDVLYLDTQVNAFASHIGGKPAVGIGMPLLAVDPIWCFKSIMAHEMGHLKAGDVDDPSQTAMSFLLAVANAPHMKHHPVAVVARHLLWSTIHDALERSRRAEHRADQWGAFVSGKGTTDASLKRSVATDAVWDNVVDDLKRLVAAGRAPKNIFNQLREALAYAADAQELRVERWLDLRDQGPVTTHPAIRDRGRAADHAVRHLDDDTQNDGPARDLLFNAGAVEERVTRRLVEQLNGGASLPVIDDRELARTAMTLGEAHVRAEIARRAGPAAEDLPFAGLFQLIHDLLTGDMEKVTWFAEVKLGDRLVPIQLRKFKLQSGPECAQWIEALLDGAVARGVLSGTIGFGIWRRVLVEEDWYIPGLASALARQQGPWEQLLKTLRTTGR